MTTGLIDPPHSGTATKRSKRPRRHSVARPARGGNFEQTELYEAFAPSRLRWSNVDWVVVAWMTAMHVGCLAAPFFFTWQAVAVFVGMHWLTASIGICLCYHRFLSHKSLKLKAPAKFVALLSAALSGEGSPLTWTATHRLHHSRSDQDGDPHSPLDGAWWSHLLWMFVNRTKAQQQALFQRYVPDLLSDRMVVFFERTYFYWLVASGVALFAIGGWPMLLWGLCVRLVVAYHSTWFVNSATHMWGYRNYDTKDESRNLWWVALLSYGEGWHNNHHAHPHTARAGHRWWELDMTFWAIRTLEFLRLATHVDDRIPTDRQPAPATE